MHNRQHLLRHLSSVLLVALVAWTSVLLVPGAALAQRGIALRQQRIAKATQLLNTALNLNQSAYQKLSALADPGEIPAIIQMLEAAYNTQAASTTPVDAIIREAKWVPEDLLKRYSYLTAWGSKPGTLRTISALRAGQIQEALGHLANAIAIQQQQLELLF